MTIYDLIQKYENATEEEQRQTFVGSIWDLEDVDAVLDTMGYADDALDADEKADCLSRAIEDGDGDNEVRDLIMENLQEVLDEKGVKADTDDGDYASFVERLDGLDLDETQYGYYREALDALYDGGDPNDAHGYGSMEEVLNDAQGCANGCVDDDDDEPTGRDGGDLKWDYDYGGWGRDDHYFDDLDWD